MSVDTSRSEFVAKQYEEVQLGFPLADIRDSYGQVDFQQLATKPLSLSEVQTILPLVQAYDPLSRKILVTAFAQSLRDVRARSEDAALEESIIGDLYSQLDLFSTASRRAVSEEELFSPYYRALVSTIANPIPADLFRRFGLLLEKTSVSANLWRTVKKKYASLAQTSSSRLQTAAHCDIDKAMEGLHYLTASIVRSPELPVSHISDLCADEKLTYHFLANLSLYANSKSQALLESEHEVGSLDATFISQNPEASTIEVVSDIFLALLKRPPDLVERCLQALFTRPTAVKDLQSANRVLQASGPIVSAIAAAQVESHYDVLSYLGQGVSGMAFRIRSPLHDADLVLKTFFAPPAELVDSFTESRALSQFQGEDLTNIVRLYGVEKSKNLNIIMEYVEGRTLASLIAESPVDVITTADYAAQILNAIRVFQEHKLSHRDLNLNNIKLRSDGTIKVMDFGVAGSVDEVQPPGINLRHSPNAGLPADDLFSLGIITYELRTGTNLIAERASVENTLDHRAAVVHAKETFYDENLELREEVKERISRMGNTSLEAFVTECFRKVDRNTNGFVNDVASFAVKYENCLRHLEAIDPRIAFKAMSRQSIQERYLALLKA